MIRTEVSVEPEIAELVPFFIESRNADLIKMRQLTAEKKFNEIARIAHSIKGIARPYGFPSMEAIARNIEAKCDESNDVEIEALLAQLSQALKTSA